MLGDTVKLVDTCNPSNSTALQMTAQQLLEGMVVIGRKKKGDYPVRSRLTSDHSIVRYQDGLQAALCSMVPLLFLGGHVSDYQPELVQYYVDQGAASVCSQFCIHDACAQLMTTDNCCQMLTKIWKSYCHLDAHSQGQNRAPAMCSNASVLTKFLLSS